MKLFIGKEEYEQIRQQKTLCSWLSGQAPRCCFIHDLIIGAAGGFWAAIFITLIW